MSVFQAGQRDYKQEFRLMPARLIGSGPYYEHSTTDRFAWSVQFTAMGWMFVTHIEPHWLRVGNGVRPGRR
jgi:hypothetical protein